MPAAELPDNLHKSTTIYADTIKKHNVWLNLHTSCKPSAAQPHFLSRLGDPSSESTPPTCSPSLVHDDSMHRQSPASRKSPKIVKTPGSAGRSPHQAHEDSSPKIVETPGSSSTPIPLSLRGPSDPQTPSAEPSPCKGETLQQAVCRLEAAVLFIGSKVDQRMSEIQQQSQDQFLELQSWLRVIAGSRMNDTAGADYVGHFHEQTRESMPQPPQPSGPPPPPGPPPDTLPQRGRRSSEIALAIDNQSNASPGANANTKNTLNANNVIEHTQPGKSPHMRAHM